jgi:hypothetical protein
MNAKHYGQLAERAYPGLKPSGYCSRIHTDEDEQVACTICYPVLHTLITAHNDLKHRAWMALGDIRAELMHGAAANLEYIERRVNEGLDPQSGATASAPDRPGVSAASGDPVARETTTSSPPSEQGS